MTWFMSALDSKPGDMVWVEVMGSCGLFGSGLSLKLDDVVQVGSGLDSKPDNVTNVTNQVRSGLGLKPDDVVWVDLGLNSKPD